MRYIIQPNPDFFQDNYKKSHINKSSKTCKNISQSLTHTKIQPRHGLESFSDQKYGVQSLNRQTYRQAQEADRAQYRTQELVAERISIG